MVFYQEVVRWEEDHCEEEENDCHHLNLNLNLNCYHLNQEIQGGLEAVVCEHLLLHIALEKVDCILHKAHFATFHHFVLEIVIVRLHLAPLSTVELFLAAVVSIGE